MTAWYNKVHYGAKAQHLWQVSFGVSSFLAFVLMPACFELVMGREMKRREGAMPTGLLPRNARVDLESSRNSELTRAVHAKALQLRAVSLSHTETDL